MKVIFLDIDGVLNSREYDAHRNFDELTNIDKTRLPYLKEIVDRTGAEIVLSSTWRGHWSVHRELCDVDGRYINDTLAEFGLKIIDKTPDLGLGAERADEISKWLKITLYKVDAFVIIDDCAFGWGKLSGNLVKTSPRVGLGLEREHVEKAVKILGEK